jgi:hypothetical protein
MQLPHQNVRRIALVAAALFPDSATTQNTGTYRYLQPTFHC